MRARMIGHRFIDNLTKVGYTEVIKAKKYRKDNIELRSNQFDSFHLFVDGKFIATISSISEIESAIVLNR